ncbi:BnaC04g26420D [Brassica napus]|uniref:BnaC04g26420D protein n=1 Tax=Brassica napus TaxID=3708 RepID=A0A078FLQ4_BRANA|nr:BnaC04g26420D [Brassica napus]
MEKQRSHPFVCIPMFKQVEQAQRQGLQVRESCGEKELISTHTVVQIEALQREVKSPFSPEVVLGKEACPKIDPETALNKFHCAHEPTISVSNLGNSSLKGGTWERRDKRSMSSTLHLRKNIEGAGCKGERRNNS